MAKFVKWNNHYFNADVVESVKDMQGATPRQVVVTFVSGRQDVYKFGGDKKLEAKALDIVAYFGKVEVSTDIKTGTSGPDLTTSTPLNKRAVDMTVEEAALSLL